MLVEYTQHVLMKAAEKSPLQFSQRSDTACLGPSGGAVMNGLAFPHKQAKPKVPEVPRIIIWSNSLTSCFK